MKRDMQFGIAVGRALGIMRRAIKDADKGKSLVVIPPHLAREIEATLEKSAEKFVIGAADEQA